MTKQDLINMGFPSLKVEPIHTVHDSLLAQWEEKDRKWAIKKVQQWFNNPFTIAGQKVTIPVGMKVGKDWGFKQKIKL